VVILSFNENLISNIEDGVGWIAPLMVYPREEEVRSLAETGYKGDEEGRERKDIFVRFPIFPPLKDKDL